MIEICLVEFFFSFSERKIIKYRFTYNENNALTKNLILNKIKNIFPFKNVFLIYLFLENKKQEVKHVLKILIF